MPSMSARQSDEADLTQTLRWAVSLSSGRQRQGRSSQAAVQAWAGRAAASCSWQSSFNAGLQTRDAMLATVHI